jgi:hypothetical protein
MKPIQGENYSHHVHPSQKLAAGAKSVLQKKLDSLSANHMIIMQCTTFNALEKEHPEWFHSVVHMDSVIKVMPKRALFLVRAKSGHRRMVPSSYYFTAFAEETSMNTRFTS